MEAVRKEGRKEEKVGKSGTNVSEGMDSVAVGMDGCMPRLRQLPCGFRFPVLVSAQSIIGTQSKARQTSKNWHVTPVRSPILSRKYDRCGIYQVVEIRSLLLSEWSNSS